MAVRMLNPVDVESTCDHCGGVVVEAYRQMDHCKRCGSTLCVACIDEPGACDCEGDAMPYSAEVNGP